MALSVANILLQVTGDSSEARRELEQVATDLALFGRVTAEAEADLDTTPAHESLDELEARLTDFSADDHTAEVNVAIAKAVADLKVLQAELERIDREEVVVDVDVRRGIVERIGSLSAQIARLGKDAEQTAQGGLSRLIRGFSDADIGVGRWSASLGSILKIGPAVAAVIVALVGQVVAIVASALNAVGAIGALAVAFAAALVPGILLATGAIAQFKAEAGKAGTAAHALAGNLKDVWNTFQGATAGGANAVFQGISDALRDLDPLVQSLGPAFTRLGKAGGDAFRLLGEQFSSPAWRQFFVFTTDSLTKLTPLFARSFGAFAKILANIAQAAMPFLIQGFRDLARVLEGLAKGTSNIEGVRSAIGGMMRSLSSWGHLLGGLIDLVGAFVKAFAPIGDSIVDSLGDGAHNLAEWLRSSEGLRKVRQFFEDTGPLASEVAKLFLNVALALIQIGQFVAPALTPIVKGLNDVIGVLNVVMSWLNDHIPAGVRGAVGSLVSLVTGFGKVGKAGELVAGAIRIIIGVLGTLGGAFGKVPGFAKDAFDKVKEIVSVPIAFILAVGREVLDAIRDIWKTAKGVVSDVIDFVLHAPRDVLGVVRDIWRTAKGIIRDIIEFVLKAPRDVLAVVRDIWRTAKNVVNDVIEFVLKVPHDAAGVARGLWQDVKGIVTDSIDFAIGFASDIVSRASDIWQKVKDKMSQGIDLVVNVIADVGGLPGKVRDLLGLASGVINLPQSQFAMVGETGPELAFLPQGTDIYTANETRRILKALASGSVRPTAAGAAAPMAGGGHTFITNNITPPAASLPDPAITVALLDAQLRARGAAA